jgi:hypothetical protein
MLAFAPLPFVLSNRLTLLVCMPLPPTPSPYCSERHRHRRLTTFSASSTPRRLVRSCCRVQVTRTALASVSSTPRHSLAQLRHALWPLSRPLPRHIGFSLLSPCGTSGCTTRPSKGPGLGLRPDIVERHLYRTGETVDVVDEDVGEEDEEAVLAPTAVC